MKKNKRSRKIITLSFITTLCGLFAFGAYKTTTYKQTKAENQTINYTMNLGGNVNNYLINNGTPTETRQTNYKISGNNNIIDVKGNWYVNRKGTGQLSTQPNHTTEYTFYTTQNGQNVQAKDNQALLIMQITPYNIQRDTVFTIKIDVTAYSNSQYPNKQLKYTWIDSIDNQLINLIDRQDWTTENSVWNYKNYIYDPDNAIEFTTDHGTRTVDNEDTHNLNSATETLTHDINIVQYSTNYVALYIYLETTQTDTASGTGIFGYFNNTDGLQFTGTQVIVVNSGEIVDIPNLMFQILTLPFSFISTAFNLTLFPGTAYQVNIGNIILIILGVLIIVFVLQIIVKALGAAGGGS